MCEIYKCPSDQVVTFNPVKPWSLLELVRGVPVVIAAGIVRCGWDGHERYPMAVTHKMQRNV